MRKRRNHPLISVLALAALVGAMLAAAAPASISMAQTTGYPGENDPISGRADGPRQFADDELALLSDAVNSTSYAVKAFSPNPDYTLPDGIVSDALPKPPPGNLVQNNTGNQRQFSVARGRIVDPARDAAVALTKVGFNHQTLAMSWALQELSFGGSHAAAHTKVPTLSFTSHVRNTPAAETSPGVVAAGDLDRAVDAKGEPHDEIVLAYEDKIRDGPDSAITLSVQRYDPGTATLIQSSSIRPLPQGEHFAYLCNISVLNDVACDRLYPGTIKLALADVDGDSFKEVALLAQIQPDNQMLVRLKLLLYSYCPPGLDAGDPRVTAKYCPAKSATYSLAPRSETVIAEGVSGTNPHPSFHNPADLVAGDFDGDGLEDLAVTHLLNQRFENPRNLVVNYKYLADVTLSVLAWTVPATAPAHLPVVWQSPADKPVASMNAWFD